MVKIEESYHQPYAPAALALYNYRLIIIITIIFIMTIIAIKYIYT